MYSCKVLFNALSLPPLYTIYGAGKPVFYFIKIHTMKAKINLSFSKFTDADFGSESQGIMTSMNISPNFPNPTPPLATVNNAVSNYFTALADAQTRDKVKIAYKNEKRSELESLLVQLGNFVTFTANGDRTLLVSSGFKLSKESESAPITKPENLQVVDGLNAGELIVSVTGVLNAKSYVHEYTTDPLSPQPKWVTTTTTSRKLVLKGLEKAKEYWCRVAAVGSSGQFVYSDTISRIVQ